MSGTAASYAPTGSGPSPVKGVQADAAQRPDSAAVAKRLQQELMSMMTSGEKGISAFPQGDSLFSWIGTIEVGDTLWLGRTGFVDEGSTAMPGTRLPAGLQTPRVQKPRSRAVRSVRPLRACRAQRPFIAFPLPLVTQGAEGTVFAGLTFRLSLSFGAEYPFKPPTVKFETGCYHPNVDLQGNICLDILKEKWSGEGKGESKKGGPGAGHAGTWPAMRGRAFALHHFLAN